MQRLLNAPENYVDEMLDGIYAAHPELVTYTADDKRCLVSRYKKPGKVGIATGGGSGHLPLFLGYVGEGMADGCSIGNVFQSPSAEQMLAVTKEIDSGAGVLYIYGNYGGDIMSISLLRLDGELKKYLAMTYGFARKIYDAKTGLISALILGTSFEYWLISKTVITDLTLFVFFNAVLVFFYLAYRSQNKNYYYLCYLFSGLAVLTKGPIGLLLPGFIVTVFICLRRDFGEVKRMAPVYLLDLRQESHGFAGGNGVSWYSQHNMDARIEALAQHSEEELQARELEMNFNWLAILRKWSDMDSLKETVKKQDARTNSRLSFLNMTREFLLQQKLIRELGNNELALTEKARTIVSAYYMETDYNRGIMVEHMAMYLQEICRGLLELAAKTRIKVGEGTKDIYSIHIPVWKDAEARNTIRGYLNDITKRLDAPEFQDETRHEDTVKVKKELQRLLRTQQIMQVTFGHLI